MKILIVESDLVMNKMIVDVLRDSYFAPDTAMTAADAVYKLKVNEYDLAIINWGFSDEKIDGLTLVKQIRASKKDIPIIIISSRSALMDRVTGLDSGADDYIVRPFYSPELVARIHAVLRRGRSHADDSHKLKKGSLVLDASSYKVTLDKQPLELSNKEFRILKCLLLQSDKVVSRAELLDKVWGNNEGCMMSNTIDVHFRRLRKKFGKLSPMIRTIRGVGYRLDEDQMKS